MIRSLATFSVWPLLLALLTFNVASGGERPKIVVGGDHDNPPYEFLENGKPTGFNIELMRAVAEATGMDVEFRLGPWSKVREELEQGKIDALAGMYYSAERNKQVDFSLPHTMVSAGLFVRKDSRVRSLEDIKGKEVIVQKGDVIHDYLRENGVTSHIVAVTNPEDELRLLASGRHDCALMPSRFQGEYLKRTLQLTDLRAISTGLPPFRYCFAVRKGNQELLYRLDEGLNILKVNGRYHDIYEKWFGVYEKRDLWETIKYYVLALALSLALFLTFLIWSGTLKKRVEQRTAELRRSEEELRFTQYAIDKTMDQAFWMTKDGRLFYINDAACRTLGYTREELVGMSIPDIDPTHPPEVFAGHWRDLQENGSVTMESLHRAKDGRVYPVEIRANYVVFDGKEYNCAFATEISERKRAAEELRQAHDELEKRVEERTLALRNANELLQQANRELSREVEARKAAVEASIQSISLLKATLESTADGILVVDSSGRIIDFNERFLELWHIPRNVIVSQDDDRALAYVLDQLINPNQFIAKVKELYGQPEEESLDVLYFRDGRVFERYSRPQRVVNQVTGRVWSFRDITDRKHAEEALKHAKEEWERTFASVPDLIAILDNQHRVLRVNEAMAKRLGLKPDECVGLHCYEAIHGLSESPPFCPHTQTLIDGRKHVVEVHEERLGGDFLVSTIPLNDERGVMIGSVHIAYDITERKRAEEALRESETRVRRKMESILDPEGDIGELDLADIIDAPQIQALMDDLYRNTGLKMSIIDLKGRVLVDVGWQDICLKFHRNHPGTLEKCNESDTILTEGVPQGEFRTYRCKNNMWHLVTPIFVGGRHMGNLFMGQFFFENEELDYDLFRAQARQYGFPEEEYIAALEAVPRHSEERVNKGKAFFLRLIEMFSKLSYGNIKLAHSLAERDRLTETLRQANMVVENSPVVLFRWKGDDEWPVELVSGNIIQFGYTPEEFLSRSISYSSVIHPDDLEWVAREVHDFCNEGADHFRLEYRIMTKGGDIRWVNELTNVERDAAGCVKNFEGIVIDVTERKLAEDSIRESRAKYQAIVDSFDGLIYICSQDYRIEFMNRKLIERTGREAVGEYCYKVMHDRDSVCPWCVNDRVFKGETVHWEMFSPKDNRWYYVVNIPIRHADGSMSKHSMIFDITDRK
ncbi:MAG: PAS domain S-box protein, partial [Geobacteraceae bacterium]